MGGGVITVKGNIKIRCLLFRVILLGGLHIVRCSSPTGCYRIFIFFSLGKLLSVFTFSCLMFNKLFSTNVTRTASIMLLLEFPLICNPRHPRPITKLRKHADEGISALFVIIIMSAFGRPCVP